LAREDSEARSNRNSTAAAVVATASDPEDNVLLSSENGFVWSVIHSYCGHHHLTLRPEDIWFAILTQFKIYINAHAEELRDVFVKHAGRQKLIFPMYDNRFTIDYGSFAKQAAALVEERILEKGLREWISPGFSTSTDEDEIVASVIMMACMEKYFEYVIMSICGIPSVTLLGQRSDYEQILRKLDHLERYGSEPTQFAALLRPVLRRMVASFDDPTCAEVVSFWRRIADPSGGDREAGYGGGRRTYGGWISAFCFWNEYGICQYRVASPVEDGGKEWSEDSGEGLDEDWKRRKIDRSRGKKADGLSPLELYSVRYGTIGDRDVPPGFARVPVKIVDEQRIYEAEMLAGSVGIVCERGGIQMADGLRGIDSMRPVTAWWMAEI